MNPKVCARALMEMKVVRSFVVVAFEMYVIHRVIEPKRESLTSSYLNMIKFCQLPAARPTMNRATIIQYFLGWGKPPRQAYRMNPIMFSTPVLMQSHLTDFHLLPSHPTMGEAISCPRGFAATIHPNRTLSAVSSICFLFTIIDHRFLSELWICKPVEGMGRPL